MKKWLTILIISTFSSYLSIGYAVVGTSSYIPTPSTIQQKKPITEQEKIEATDYLSETEQPVQYKDPLEKYNRIMYHINDAFDKYVAKPLAQFYNKAMPKPLNIAVDNFFLNIKNVPNIANDFLQFNFYQGISDIWRLSINTTVGIGGLFDVASPLGLPDNPQDFGLTFAKWGWENSTYFVVPFFGPKTIRDTLGIPFQYLVSIYPMINDVALRNSLFLLSCLDDRAQLLRFEDVYEQIAMDPYIFIRNAYLQRRDYLIKRVHELGTPYTAKESQMAESEENYYINE